MIADKLTLIKSLYPYYNKYIKKKLIYYIEIVIALLISNFINIIFPFLTKTIIDDALIGKDLKLFLILLIALTVIQYFMVFWSSIIRYIYDFLVGNTSYLMETDLFYHFIKLPVQFFDTRQTGDILKRISDANVIQNFLGILLFDVVNNLFLVFINIFACIYINPVLTVILLLFFPVYYFYNVILGRISKKYESEKWNKEQVLFSKQNETINGIRIIKAFALESKVMNNLKLLVLKLRQYNLKYRRKFIFLEWIYSFFNSGENFIIFLIGGFFIINGKLTLGEWFAFQTISNQVFSPLKALLSLNKAYQGNVVIFERLNEVNQLKEEKNRSLTTPHFINDGEIRFENVYFSYQPGHQVLKNINLEIKKGQKIALVGRSGSGKTTLVNLIAKFYLPEKGNIIIDGIDIAEYDIDKLRNSIGMVLQSSYFFYGTIMENLLLVSPNKNREEIIEACIRAEAHEFITAFPDGYHTKLGEKGVTLSGGEKQRLSIAQALLKNPKILILDEATSHLDMETEAKVQTALQELMAGRTSIVIAHRLNTIENADTIAVIENGEIIETGSHQELIKKDSFYRKLYARTASL